MSAPLSLAAWLAEWRALPDDHATGAAYDAREAVDGLMEHSISRMRTTALGHLDTLLGALARDEVQP